jgi:AmmeMemoRadiSam system protein A
MLTDEQKQLVLELARLAVIQQVNGTAELATIPCELPEASGVFVTLKTRGALRGCLGTLNCRAPLEHEIARCAADAASSDPRFEAVSREELPDISIEVSLLGPLELIDPTDPDAIEMGRHGLVVEDGRRRGVLLPQVALEWDWTRDQFLRQTCIKAGVGEDAWEHGALVFRFEAEVFGH